ncbi:DUF1467 family protein [Paracoccus amoyensis]|uniref:DUF1467 family protein n=1 Tax=Paracoccus amoyensis TaxID=2760093 RepID=UPI0031B5C781
MVSDLVHRGVVGQRSQQDAGHVVPGTHAGAPADLKVKPILIRTTLITVAIWGLIAWIILSGVVTRADVANFDQIFR